MWRRAFNFPFLLPLLLLFAVSGEQGSLTHGSVVDGRFEGFIKTYQGTYYVEPSERYIKDKNASFHSIIYHEDDIGQFPRRLRLRSDEVESCARGH